MGNNVRPLAGVVSLRARKEVYVFAVDFEDFQSFVGDGFLSTQGKFKGKYISISEEYIHVHVTLYMDIVSIRGPIEVEFTTEYQEKCAITVPQIERLVRRTNYIHSRDKEDPIDPEILPKVIKELMQEPNEHDKLSGLF